MNLVREHLAGRLHGGRCPAPGRRRALPGRERGAGWAAPARGVVAGHGQLAGR